MLYALICRDNPANPANLRPDTRPAHLAYLRTLGEQVKCGGALLSDDESKALGSLLIIEANSLEDARAIAANDPYAQAGVFESVEIRPWRQAVGGVTIE